MSGALLDVNVLVALAWPNHVHHGVAADWFGGQRALGWATCSITQLGFMRVSAHVGMTPHAVEPAEAAEVLVRLLELGDHHFLADASQPADADWRFAATHRSITDLHLARLARDHGCVLATLDRGIAALTPVPAAVRCILDG